MVDALRIDGLCRNFGGVKALNNVSFGLQTGELLAVIGPNGSGKTTLLNVLTGHLAPNSGTVSLFGKRVGGRSPDAIARAGMIRTFQLSRIFARLSVQDNLKVTGLALGLDETDAQRRAGELLEQVGLDGFAGKSASALSGGQKKLLEFAGCFIGEPRVVLLDEPFSAVSASMKDVMVAFIRARQGAGGAIVVVSHDIPIVAELCPRTVCMAAGVVLADAPTDQVLSDPRVIESYLGGSH